MAATSVTGSPASRSARAVPPVLTSSKPRATRAAAKAVPMTGGVLLQFPLYAGIYGIIKDTGLVRFGNPDYCGDGPLTGLTS